MNEMSVFWAVVLYVIFIVALLILRITSLNRKREREEAAMRIREERESLERLARQRKEEHQRGFITEQRRLMSDSLRYDVLRRDNFRCQLCGSSAKDGVKLHVDHILPVSKGGKTEMSNLRTLCERCNLGKGAKIE